MPRERTGWTGQDEQGRWFYRYQYTDASGVRRNIRSIFKGESKAKRLLKSEAEAKNELRKALNKFDTGGERVIEGERLKFNKLASIYSARSIIKARYVGERKVAGRRSIAPVEVALRALEEHFGNRRIKDIKHHDIEQYKLERLDTPKSNGKERSIASVNRELELMRAMMRFAVRQGWLMRSPFEMGAPLISKSDEERRERVLTRDEERRLLEACGDRILTYERKGKEVTMHDKGDKREHLRALLVAALDTAMRRGELFKLTWQDVDLERGVITIRAMNSKTARARTVGITPRLHEELSKLLSKSPRQPGLSVFGYDSENGTLKTAWASLCDYAKVKDFRFHDCRHTAVTRMVEAGMPSAQIMKISGHTQMTTFQRYVNPNHEAVTESAKRLHEHNTQSRAHSEQRAS
jgi:integrase